MTNEAIELFDGLFRGREPSRRGRVSRADCCWSSRENPRSVRLGQSVGVHHQNGQRSAWSGRCAWAAGAIYRSTTSGQRTGITAGGPSPVWCRWHATSAKESRLSAESAGLRVFWAPSRARDTDRRRGTQCAPSCSGTVCRSSARLNQAHKVPTIWNSRCEFEGDRWRRSVRLSRGPVLKKPQPSRAKPSSECESFPLRDKPESRPSNNDGTPDLPPSLRPTATLRGLTSTNVRQLTCCRIDLLTGKVHAIVRDRHRSRDSSNSQSVLDAAYPAGTAIKLIVSSLSFCAYIERTRALLDARPP